MSMNKTILLVGVIVILFLTTSFSGCIELGPLKHIETSANIPYHSGGGVLEEGVGSCGTLYCNGLIIETTAGVEYIELDWTADVIFPSDYIGGFISWGDTWGDDPLSGDVMPIIGPPDNPGVDIWRNNKGLNTVWELEMKIYRDDIHFWFHSTTHGLHATYWSSDVIDAFGYEDILQGKHFIFSAFGSDETPYGEPSVYDMDIFIRTSPFYLVRDGADFWFE